MTNRFVNPGVDRIEISEGDWIEIKVELSVGEQKKLESLPLTTLRAPEGVATPREIGLNWGAYYLGKLEIYLVDWSLKDRNDKVMPVNRDSIASLTQATAQEITEAIDASVARGKVQRATPTIPTPSPADSGS
jgi:hypothetical protein